MGSPISGPANPNDQLFSDASNESASGPGLPPDGAAEDLQRQNIEELLDEKTGAAAAGE